MHNDISVVCDHSSVYFKYYCLCVGVCAFTHPSGWYDERESGALFLSGRWMNEHPVPALEASVCDMAAECDVAAACVLML